MQSGYLKVFVLSHTVHIVQFFILVFSVCVHTHTEQSYTNYSQVYSSTVGRNVLLVFLLYKVGLSLYGDPVGKNVIYILIKGEECTHHTYEIKEIVLQDK